MSHELRTPLNSLLILAQSFMANKKGNLTVEQQEEAKIIYEAGSDLLSLINDILDISKVEAGKLTIEVGVVTISEVVAVLVKQFKPLADKKSLQLLVDFDEKTLVPDFETDQMRLLQILKNLLSNAIKFTAKGSVTLRITQSDGVVSFHVTDTGIGIPKDKQKLVFAEFQQADGSTSRQYGGTGLGLSISRKLAELMQGSLSLVSKEGKGSTFILTLPVALSSYRPDEKIQSKAGQPVELTQLIVLPDDINKIAQPVADDRTKFDKDLPSILIIDDDRKFANALAKTIKADGFQVLIALEGKVGLMLAAAYKPTGVILDLGLPDINGEDVLRALKQDGRKARIPVHVVSAQDKSNKPLSLGALSFLQKPVKEEDIKSLLEKVSFKQLNRLLIVEDDQVAKKGLKEIFSELSESVEIEFAETAAQAIAKLGERVYACIVVDLGLPDTSGVSLIQTLVDEMNIMIPIVVYTARELTEAEYKQINKYTNKVVVKGGEATERLFDEV